MSCASWRPDPRHGAEPREPSDADWTSPAETGCRAASAPLRAASRLRCGSACPRTNPLSEDFNGLGRTPERAHADVVASRGYPQFRCTNLTPSCAQTLAVNTGHPGSRWPASPACWPRTRTAPSGRVLELYPQLAAQDVRARRPRKVPAARDGRSTRCALHGPVGCEACPVRAVFLTRAGSGGALRRG